MRLQKYILNESGIIIHREENEKTLDNAKRLIHEDCKPYLKLVRSLKKIAVRMYHYKTEGVDPFFTKAVVRKDRKPVDTNKKLHKAMDDEFQKKFGWRVRSNGAFTFIWKISSIGDSIHSIFLPIGKFDYTWSPSVHDTYVDISATKFLNNDAYRKEVMNSYIMNDGFNKIFNQEVVWRCKYYYLLRFFKIDGRAEELNRILDL